MKKFLLVLMAILWAVSFQSISLAEEAPPPNVSPNLYSSYGSWTNPLRSSDFDFDYVSYGIEKTSSSSVFVMGTTKSTKNISNVSVLVTVQKWENNRWNNYKSVSASSFSATECSKTATISVDTNYYYRVKVIHSLHSGGDTKTKTSYSDSILVN